eukprot:g44431.t1
MCCVYGWLMIVLLYVTDLTLKQWIAITAQDRSSTAVMQKYIARRHKQDEGACRQLSGANRTGCFQYFYRSLECLFWLESFYSVNTLPVTTFNLYQSRAFAQSESCILTFLPAFKRQSAMSSK